MQMHWMQTHYSSVGTSCFPSPHCSLMTIQHIAQLCDQKNVFNVLYFAKQICYPSQLQLNFTSKQLKKQHKLDIYIIQIMKLIPLILRMKKKHKQHNHKVFPSLQLHCTLATNKNCHPLQLTPTKSMAQNPNLQPRINHHHITINKHHRLIAIKPLVNSLSSTDHHMPSPSLNPNH